MPIPKYNEIISFSNNQIFEEISKTEKELFNLRFKKATRQSFKPHQIKHTKLRLAHLKTLLTLRIDSLEESDN